MYNASGREMRVPITWAYNHHYGPILAGSGTELKKVRLDGPADPRNPHTGHPNPDGTVWVVEDACVHLAGDWHDEKSASNIALEQSGCAVTASGPWASPATGQAGQDGVLSMNFHDGSVFNATLADGPSSPFAFS